MENVAVFRLCKIRCGRLVHISLIFSSKFLMRVGFIHYRSSLFPIINLFSPFSCYSSFGLLFQGSSYTSDWRVFVPSEYMPEPSHSIRFIDFNNISFSFIRAFILWFTIFSAPYSKCSLLPLHLLGFFFQRLSIFFSKAKLAVPSYDKIVYSLKHFLQKYDHQEFHNKFSLNFNWIW